MKILISLISGNRISEICIHDHCNKEALYNYWGMKPRYCIDHKDEYHINIYENPVTKKCNYENCKKKQLYIIIQYCFDHKDKDHVNIPKKHILCITHYISHSRTTICPKCKIKKSPKCDECNITASYYFPKLRPLKCLSHRKKGMINIKKKHVLCEKHDISHSEKTKCKKCKLDLDNYDTSSKYMTNKIYKNYKKEFIAYVKKKFKNHPIKQMMNNVLNNSPKDEHKKFKKIVEERKKQNVKKRIKIIKIIFVKYVVII